MLIMHREHLPYGHFQACYTSGVIANALTDGVDNEQNTGVIFHSVMNLSTNLECSRLIFEGAMFS